MNRVLIIGSVAILSGCQFSNDSDLNTFIAQTKAAAKITATQVPELPRYQAELFQLSGVKNPFFDFETSDDGSDDTDISQCWQPDYDAELYPLSDFDLSELAFKGVIGQSDALWALFETPEGAIARVGAGDIVGINHGRINSVQREEIDITEQLPDGKGCWQEKNTKLALN
ncbi:hypothetical protein A8L45_12895 [Veronia pacifica]|uniref:Pilus assembly protein PilP n=1 Tax=Veronia pacifica TaxID=1080227 RepID=A0A1C3EGR2_9GAMM|nr:hypothetical protein A8L45_12895 [Veronia pacifica]